MKILIGSDERTMDSMVSKRFGHAPYFLVYDNIENKLNVFENNNEDDDHANLQKFITDGVAAFIVGNIGPHAFEKINSPKTKIFLARSISVKEALIKLEKNELTVLTEPTAKKSIGHNH
jgi:predicted Fe-Mo cluster-binding NifX family protein